MTPLPTVSSPPTPSPPIQSPLPQDPTENCPESDLPNLVRHTENVDHCYSARPNVFSGQTDAGCCQFLLSRMLDCVKNFLSSLRVRHAEDNRGPTPRAYRSNGDRDDHIFGTKRKHSYCSSSIPPDIMYEGCANREEFDSSSTSIGSDTNDSDGSVVSDSSSD
eukprot:CAMPEP_0194328238 /NCGR_PEP_ID=MMETSP0171-20130528/43992_1 /TAXON_ID=218684 /ORGANISM="Corethron pennatum, Strain L29A3" /LENGTH=162 /DNA_ID=CAMNT_0039088495 /DNA_START=46 /DNA_END=531 /DNA_ORIENTATION=+